MRPRSHRRRAALLSTLLVLGTIAIAGLSAARAVLLPRVDSPTRVEAIVVVAGAADDRYVYARHLAEIGVADRILVSQPSPGGDDSYSAAIDAYCENSPVTARDGRRIEIDCFEPDVSTTEGETTAATRIAREHDYESLLMVTYWGHVSRVRMYFEQCFDGPVLVTDTPRPLSRSRKDALLHETGGYVKAFLKPAC
ncbi:ElyC/SanA/YdcF family protein [Dietzia maris]